MILLIQPRAPSLTLLRRSGLRFWPVGQNRIHYRVKRFARFHWISALYVMRLPPTADVKLSSRDSV